jgi:hypothetical protein
MPTLLSASRKPHNSHSKLIHWRRRSNGGAFWLALTRHLDPILRKTDNVEVIDRSANVGQLRQPGLKGYGVSNPG